MIDRLFKLIFFFLLLFSISVFPQQISSINVFSKKLNKDFFLPVTNKFLNKPLENNTLDTLQHNIAEYLLSNSYYTFNFDSTFVKYLPDSSKVDIFIFLNEGFKTIINNFFIEGLTNLDSINIYEKLSFLINQDFNKNLINPTFEEILQDFENLGHPFSSIIINSVNLLSDSINKTNLATIYLKFNKNEKSIIDSIKIDGNTKTKDYVILRALDIEKGESYNQQKINLIPSRLNRLRFFEPVKTPEYYVNKSGKGILKISVTETETNNFDGLLGYVPANSDKEKGFFVGFININLRNILGTGRGLYFKWQQINRFSQELELKYLEPYLLDFPLNLNFGLYQKKQDTTYVTRSYNAALEYLATKDISAMVTFSFATTIPTENLYSKFSVYNSNTFATGFNFITDTKDDFYSPRKGIYFNVGYKYGKKKINGPIKYITPITKTKIELQKYESDFELYLEPIYRQILAFSLHGRQIKGDAIEISDLYELGGNNSLRGYREKQFLANSLLWSNIEFRSLLTRRSYAFLFLDYGYILRKENIETKTQKQSFTKYGYGFGISLETGIGMLKVSYAIPSGGNLNEGFIHFGIANEF